MLICYLYTGKLIVSTSCSLLHTAVDKENETMLDEEIKSWLAFAAQKVVEVSALTKALTGNKDEVFEGPLSILLFYFSIHSKPDKFLCSNLTKFWAFKTL